MRFPLCECTRRRTRIPTLLVFIHGKGLILRGWHGFVFFFPTQHLRKEEWASVSQKDNSTSLARTVQKDSTLFIVDIAVSRQEKKQFNSSSSQGKRKVSTPNTTGNAEWSSQESTPSTIGKWYRKRRLIRKESTSKRRVQSGGIGKKQSVKAAKVVSAWCQNGKTTRASISKGAKSYNIFNVFDINRYEILI